MLKSEQIKHVVCEIIDIASSGCGSWDNWHFNQFENVFKPFSESDKVQIWDELKSHLNDGEGWDISEIKYLMGLCGVKEFTITI